MAADARAGVDRRPMAWRALWLASLGLTLIACLAVVLGNWMAGRSVDVAAHYVRVNYFFQSWHLLPQADSPMSRNDAVPARCVSHAAELATAILIDYGCK
jgi:hypothetical protein